MNIDRYCVRCDSEVGFSETRAEWCNICWDRRQPVPSKILRELQAPVFGHAESIEINSDEAGFEMRVVTGDGDYHFNIHGVAWDFAAHVDEEIGSWRREGERARGTMPARVTQDDLDAYPLGDPKRITLEREMRRQR